VRASRCHSLSPTANPPGAPGAKLVFGAARPSMGLASCVLEGNGAMAKQMERCNLGDSQDVRNFEHGQVQVASLGGVKFGRATLQPGWKWSTCVKPIAKTPSCQAPHLQYHISGRLRVVMDDGSEAEFGAGDVALIPPGHDAWVVGNEPVVVLDISGMGEFARPH
jgi:hypothetical protein